MLKKIIFFSLLACAAVLAFAFNKLFFAESAEKVEPAKLRLAQEEQVQTTAKDITAAIREKYKINDAFLLISKENFTLLYIGDTQIQKFPCAIGKKLLQAI